VWEREKTLRGRERNRSLALDGSGGSCPFLLPPRPSCRSPKSLLSVEEAVRVHSGPGPSPISDWALDPRICKKWMVAGALSANHRTLEQATSARLAARDRHVQPRRTVPGPPNPSADSSALKARSPSITKLVQNCCGSS
jgi:hypothetical protein